MPLFRRSKHKSPPTTSPAFRSVENLLSNPPGVVDLDRRFSVSTTQDASSKPLPQPHSSATQPSFPRRAQSQRRSQNFESLSTVNPPVPTTTLNTTASTTPTTTTTTTTTTTATTIPPVRTACFCFSCSYSCNSASMLTPPISRGPRPLRNNSTIKSFRPSPVGVSSRGTPPTPRETHPVFWDAICP